jgi:hypothetical protein
MQCSSHVTSSGVHPVYIIIIIIIIIIHGFAVTLFGLDRFLQFLNPLVRGISPSVAQDNTNRIKADIQASRWIRTHASSIRAGKDSSCRAVTVIGIKFLVLSVRGKNLFL